jgi:adenylate cyclase
MPFHPDTYPEAMSTTNLHTIVFADIVDSTQLYETAGDNVAKQLITDLENEIAKVVQQSGGHMVEIIGDEVMSRFDEVVDAVSCACLIQENVESYTTRNGNPMSVRIGLHYGPAIFENGRMFGDSVNVAARMAAIAKGRQIITTEQVVEALSEEQKHLARLFDRVRVKGKQEKMVIYDLLWRTEDVTYMRPIEPDTPTEYVSLVLRYAGKTVMVPGRGRFRIGREAHNELVVASDMASRTHAILEFSRGKFILTDMSTNGTYIEASNQPSIFLRREALPLMGSGRIGLGEPVTTGNRHIINYDDT